MRDKDWIDSWWGKWIRIPLFICIVIVSGVGTIIVLIHDFIKEFVMKDWS